jgi:6,7-dimethyl-8-ribityllumazine synthase
VSGAGSPTAQVRADGARVAVVAASWHEEIMAGLIAGAVRVIDGAGAHAEVVRVPGSFELPLAAAAAAGSFDAVVALGVVVRGGTPHFDYVCAAATDGLTAAALGSGVPVGFGLLTCDTYEQARDRAGLPGSSEDKGAEAAAAALQMVGVLGRLAGGAA